MRDCFCGGSVTPSSYRDQFHDQALLRCNACGTLLIEATPSAEALATFYNDAYSEDRQRFVTDAYFEIMRRRAAAQVRLIAGHLDLKGATVLDYGCGYGLLLDALRDAGAITCGFDHDPKCVAMLRDKGHQIVEEDAYRDAGAAWDLVCFSHVVEHLPDPETLLSEARRSARAIFIEVPRYDATLPEQFADLEGHLWFFTEPSLAALVGNAGWRISELTTAGPSLRLFWRGGMAARLMRKARRKLSNDWFFGQYERQGADGMWIRLIAKAE